MSILKTLVSSMLPWLEEVNLVGWNVSIGIKKSLCTIDDGLNSGIKKTKVSGEPHLVH